MSLMNYNTLVAAKGTPGSIADWLAWTKLIVEAPVCLDEAQTLIMNILRIREMRTATRFTMLPGMAEYPLPSDFLDPIGQMFGLDYDWAFDQKDENWLSVNRQYQNTNGALGANPFTTATNSTQVSVYLANHGFSQDSSFYTTGATAFNGVTIAGTFNILSVTDVNDFVIDITPLGVLPSGAGAGGGSSVIYTCNSLIIGQPAYWAIWDEKFHFDQAFTQQMTCELGYFKNLASLSSTNNTNVLTSRYPHLLRRACNVWAAQVMRDTETYNTELTQLTTLAQLASEKDDLSYRSASIMTETP